ncbi:MAG: hypothetical protein ACLQBD_06775 [Syntrophobacteraceae bacterium]
MRSRGKRAHRAIIVGVGRLCFPEDIPYHEHLPAVRFRACFLVLAYSSDE